MHWRLDNKHAGQCVTDSKYHHPHHHIYYCHNHLPQLIVFSTERSRDRLETTEENPASCRHRVSIVSINWTEKQTPSDDARFVPKRSRSYPGTASRFRRVRLLAIIARLDPDGGVRGSGHLAVT